MQQQTHSGLRRKPGPLTANRRVPQFQQSAFHVPELAALHRHVQRAIAIASFVAVALMVNESVLVASKP